MNKFIALAVGGFVALTASQALAGTTTVTGTFGPTPTDFTNSAVTIPGFTGSNLQSVSVVLTASGNASGTLQNKGSTAQTFTFNQTTVITLSGGSFSVSVPLNENQTFTNVAPQATVQYGPLTPSASATVAGTPLSAFQTGTVTLLASSVTSDGFTGGGGNIGTSIVTTGAGTVSVTYTFADPVTTVPEPASMALLGMGLAGLGLIRRRSI